MSSTQTVNFRSLVQLQVLFTAVRFNQRFFEKIIETQNIAFTLDLHDYKVKDKLVVTGFTETTLIFHSERGHKIEFYTESNTFFNSGADPKFYKAQPEKEYIPATLSDTNQVSDIITSFAFSFINLEKYKEQHEKLIEKHSPITVKI